MKKKNGGKQGYSSASHAQLMNLGVGLKDPTAMCCYVGDYEMAGHQYGNGSEGYEEEQRKIVNEDVQKVRNIGKKGR